jgi:uncharacterized protein YjgD (DUF1641 family)
MSAEVLKALQALDKRLDGIEASISPLTARMGALEGTLDTLSTLGERAPVVVNGMAGVVNDYVLDAADRGIDVVERGQLAMDLAEKASDPEALVLIGKLMERTDVLALTVELTDELMKRRALLDTALELSDKLASVVDKPEFKSLVERTTSDSTALSVADKGTQALVETGGAGIEPVGPIGAFFKMRDPDVQRAVGFSLALAKRFGQLLA